MIILPGIDQQVRFFTEAVDLQNKRLLIIGPGTVEAAQMMSVFNPVKVIIIVDNYDSLLTERYKLEKNEIKNIDIRMMDYTNSDFRKDSFEAIFAQASVSGSNRNKIIKEIKKILTEDGIFCAGEITKLKDNEPQFVKDIWQNSDLTPMKNDELEKFYSEKGFEIVAQKDLSFTLKEFYRESGKQLKATEANLRENEKSYYKKLLKKISHESNVYLRLGGDEYIGFTALIMRKKSV